MRTAELSIVDVAGAIDRHPNTVRAWLDGPQAEEQPQNVPLVRRMLAELEAQPT